MRTARMVTPPIAFRAMTRGGSSGGYALGVFIRGQRCGHEADGRPPEALEANVFHGAVPPQLLNTRRIALVFPVNRRFIASCGNRRMNGRPRAMSGGTFRRLVPCRGLVGKPGEIGFDKFWIHHIHEYHGHGILIDVGGVEVRAHELVLMVLVDR